MCKIPHPFVSLVFTYLFLSIQATVELSDREKSQLAAAISMRDMKRIAAEHLGFQLDVIQNIVDEAKADTYDFNIKVLNKWSKQSSDNSRSVR